MLGLFRVDEAHEIEGLDVVKHNEPAYPIGNDEEYVYSNTEYKSMLF